MWAPPFATKQRPPHLENPGSATVYALGIGLLYLMLVSIFDKSSFTILTLSQFICHHILS